MLLLRVADNSIATYGVLIHGGTPFALTLERPWRENRRGESCIPAGRYTCRRVKSPKFGDTFEIVNVPGRSAILFHKGNIDDDTHGCILVGEQFEPVLGKPGIVASKEGFAEFLGLLRLVDEFPIEIVYAKEGA
jgi:hypothetical protein